MVVAEDLLFLPRKFKFSLLFFSLSFSTSVDPKKTVLSLFLLFRFCFLFQLLFFFFPPFFFFDRELLASFRLMDGNKFV